MVYPSTWHSMKRKGVSLLINAARLLLGTTFILSGYVKAIDPIGTQYKMEDYLSAIGLTSWGSSWLLLCIAVLLAATEFALGIFLLFAIRRRLSARLTLGFMSVMTLITIWLVVANPIKDCGCFGDALKLTNAASLAKNVVLLIAALLVAWKPLGMVRFISKPNQWIVINYTLLFILASSAWSLWYLPLFDFRPYHIGANIPQGMRVPPGAPKPKFENTFIMEKNGKRREFTLDNYPDSTWKYIETKTVMVSQGYTPPIHDFNIETHDGTRDLTQEILGDTGYSFLLIAPHLEQADDSNFGDIDQIYEYAIENGYRFCCLTASAAPAIARWQDLTGAEYPFYATDETTLRTIIRSNPGLLLIKHGTIIRKWSHHDLPQLSSSSPRLETSGLGSLPKDSIPGKVTIIVLWFILPLLLLTIADRTWMWTRYVRQQLQRGRQNIAIEENKMLTDISTFKKKNK